MVSTRHHPKPFPEPELPLSRTPGKQSSTTPSSPTRTTSPPSPTIEAAPVKRTPARRAARKSIVEEPSEDTAPTTTLLPTKSKRSARSKSQLQDYIHYPSSLILTWLPPSLVLVFWDTGYVLGRPHTMPGGRFHSPVWTPYALYGTVDYIYGWPAWDKHNGFTAAQGSLNVIETVMYAYYLYVVFSGVADGWRDGVIDKLWRQGKKGRIAVQGPNVAMAIIVCWAAAVMTVSKTVLYGLNECFSHFENIGHNNFASLLWLWIIPNGAWLVFPSYMIWVLGKEILSAMHVAGESREKEN